MNDDAALYSENCQIQKEDSKRLLDTHLPLLNWQDGDHVLDIGAADGTVTLEILLPRIPIRFNHVVLADAAEKMVNFAKQRIENERVEAVHLDVTSIIPETYKQYFNHIFSFYCINCIGGEERQQRTMQNIYDMLKPGGDILLSIISYTPYTRVWEEMVKLDKWKPYMQDYLTYVAPYSYTEDPPQMLKGFLETAGFAVTECRLEERCYTFHNLEEFMGFTIAVTPFVKHIPEEDLGDYYADLEIELRRTDWIDFEKSEDGGEKIDLSYTILIALATKPQ